MKKITGIMASVLLIVISAAVLVFSMVCIWIDMPLILVEKVCNTILVLLIWMVLSFVVSSVLEK